ncbi:flagellar filament capping protein FliD [Tissierella carlieri]|uniref:flagellar filament capping protein FliD n=1 Tax=Tissierella carlieri TaxID=689904 RepID=UPI001C111201|nr:flagellar filament capping protein FliD [Tissierella carlieri]MBU5310793.1 flagellar filament capping protein FliD [Tissierella carlieri]
MSNLRISGLASGMDTDAMVQSLMKVERLKVSRYEQSRQVALWRQEAYNNMNKMFASFILNTKKDMGLTKITSTGLSFGNSYSNLDYIRKATSSNETAATVSSTSKAVNGSFSLEVEELAKGATIVDDGINEETLKDIKDIEIKLSIGETEKTMVIDKSKVSNMNDLVKQINSYKDENGKSIEVTSFYDKENKKLFLQTSETGDKVELMLSYDKEGSDYKCVNNQKGNDAKVLYNGVELKYSSNRFELNGLNIELKAQGITNIKVDTNVDGIMEKIEKLINDYNELVDKSSKALNEKRYSKYQPLSQEEKKAMHEDDVKLWEEKAKSGMLNSDAIIQRALQDARVDIYRTVENAKGSFNHITQIGISTEKYARGTTGGKLQIDKEKLREAIEKDPEAVMELLFTEPEKVKRSDYPEGDEGSRLYEAAERKNRRDNGGIFTRVYDNLMDGMKSIIDKSGPGEDAELFRSVKSNILIDFVTKKSSISDLDKEVLDADRKIDDLNVMLYRKENAYYAKFANMEKMLHQMNSQSNWLTQQLMR